MNDQHGGWARLSYAATSVLAVFAVGVVLAACGSSSLSASSSAAGSSSPSGSVSTTLPSDAVSFARCMRANGTPNYPDPNSNGTSGPSSAINQATPAFRAAAQACAKLQPGGEVGPPAPSAAQVRAAVAFAQCIRVHGLSQFPDPLTTAPGARAYLTVGGREYFPAIGTTEVQSPAFRHAAKACGVQLP